MTTVEELERMEQLEAAPQQSELRYRFVVASALASLTRWPKRSWMWGLTGREETVSGLQTG
jgi:hypothetical protein